MIGWADSPFQFEVAVANLGIGLVGVIGFWRSRDFALAATLMASCFLGGAAFGHIRLIIEQADFAPGINPSPKKMTICWLRLCQINLPRRPCLWQWCSSCRPGLRPFVLTLPRWRI
jgi:hypothetical protein